MSDYVLYHCPGSCSRVAMVALEEIGLPYQDKGVALMSGAHYQPAFLSVNPKSKVPVLIAGGTTITELPVILMFLARQHPEAALLPVAAEGSVTLESQSDMAWFAGALHPLANRMFRPGAVSKIDADGIKAGAIEQLSGHVNKIVARLDGRPFLYGDEWSIADTFLAWVLFIAGQFGLPMEEFPALVAHGRRVEARPSFARAVQRERNSVQRDGLAMPPGMSL